MKTGGAKQNTLTLLIVGGGKAVNGKLKNYYPKHLRIKG